MGGGFSPSHTLPPLGRFAPSHISSKPPVAPPKLLLLLEPRLHAWHYKRLTNCRQHANIEIIYMYASEENCRVSAFKNLPFLSLVLLVLRIFCRYNMTFNREILGGGGGTQEFTAIGDCTMQMRENRPQKSTLNEDLMVYQKAL